MTRLLASYQRAICDADVVSFDVFDTLIHRVVFRPKDVFELLELKLTDGKIGLGSEQIPNNFAKARVSSESLARLKFHEKFGSHEVSLQEIYDTLAQELGLDPNVVSALIEEEIALEEFLVYPNPVMQSLLAFAKSEGKRVILCSDMYLPTAAIERLLVRSGYSPPFELFVSGTLRSSKHEGTLFHHVLDQLKIPKDRLVHFGDNQHADVTTPRKQGIKSLHWPHIEEQVSAQVRFSSDKGSAPLSLIQGIVQKALIEASHPSDFWFDLGFQIYGPLFLGKFLWFIQQIKSYQPDKVLFFARDAHIHHRLYLQYAKALGVEAPCEYAYFSRASLQMPSFTELRIERLWYLYSGKAGRSVGAHLKRLGVDPRDVQRELAQAGYRGLEDPVTNGCPQMFSLLKTIYPQLLSASLKSRDRIRRYIRQMTQAAQKIAILDIGWVGNMQGGFSRLLQLDRTDFEIRGYYYGTFEHVGLNDMPRNHFFSYLVDRNEPRSWHQALLSGGVELLEFAQMAPHGTTLGYEEIDGIIQPKMENNQADQEMQGLSFRIQEGAESFIQTIMPYVLEIGADQLVSEDWAMPFLRLVTQPTLEEANHLGEIYHSDSPTTTDIRLQLAPKLTSKNKRIAKDEYLDSLERSYWKAGFRLRNPAPRGCTLAG